MSRLSSATLSQLAFLGESDPNFPLEKLSLGQNGKKGKKGGVKRSFADQKYEKMLSGYVNFKTGNSVIVNDLFCLQILM